MYLTHGREVLGFIPSTDWGVPHISLVFREMWDTTNLHVSVLGLNGR
jgi:hypothetical protein